MRLLGDFFLVVAHAVPVARAGFPAASAACGEQYAEEEQDEHDSNEVVFEALLFILPFVCFLLVGFVIHRGFLFCLAEPEG